MERGRPARTALEHSTDARISVDRALLRVIPPRPSGRTLIPGIGAKADPWRMLILDKPRALDRMVYLSDRKGNAVPTEFLRSAPLRWSVDAAGRRALAGEVVLRPLVLVEPSTRLHEQELIAAASPA
jgi:hypothetical protein